MMFRNYLKVAIRNLKRHTLYSAINIFGLAVGMACCFLIMLFVLDELSYDRFHKNADRIYRLEVEIGDEKRTFRAPRATVLWLDALSEKFPEIEAATGILPPWSEGWLVSVGDSQYRENRFLYGDNHFLKVFHFSLLRGDAENILNRPDAIVITQSMAAKYFGDENPIGKFMTVDRKFWMSEFLVTGVVQDVPHNSHFDFDFLIHHDNYKQPDPKTKNLYTYVSLAKGTSSVALVEKLEKFAVNFDPALWMRIQYDRTVYKPFLKPLTDIHLYSHLRGEIKPNRKINDLYLFGGIGALILLIACINYMNLTTARSAGRAKEVGVRKVVGAFRPQLFGQLLGESTVMAFAAMVIAAALVEICLPFFNSFIGKPLQVVYFSRMGLGMVVLAVIVGLLAGSYPACFLSAFKPVRVLKGFLHTGQSGSWFRKGLVVCQFLISIGFIVIVIVMNEQFHLMKTKQLGFDKDQVVVIPVEDVWKPKLITVETQSGPRKVMDENGSHHFVGGMTLETTKRELLQDPRIRGVASTEAVPGYLEGSTFGGARVKYTHNEDKRIWLQAVQVDPDFIDVMGIQLVAGENFPDGYTTKPMYGNKDHQEWVLINEKAAKRLGEGSPIGKQVWREMGSNMSFSTTKKGEITNDYREILTVIGVVKDFHLESLHNPIRSLTIRRADNHSIRYLVVRLGAEDVVGALDFLREKWQVLAPGYPFEYSFLNEDLDRLYDSELQLLKAFSTFSLFAIGIACLGLFGLATFTAERKTKEIGIRKVLGASVSGIVLLLSKDFVKLVLIANVIAWPVAYWVIQDWLASFAYRIDLGWEIFVLSGGLALGIALLTVGYQAWQAARSNPVDALRYE